MTTVPARGPDCLSAEDLAAMIDGRMSGDLLARARRHLGSCDDCAELLAEVSFLADEMAAVPEPSDERPVPFPTRGDRRPVLTWTVAAAGLAAVLALAFVLPWSRPVPASSSPAMVELVRAAGAERPSEARLTGGFEWAPAPSAARTGRGQADVSPDLLIAFGQLGRNLQASRTPRSVGEHAIGSLFMGQFDQAVLSLEEATGEEPHNAALWTDLAAAYVARHARNGPGTDLPRALDATDRALRLNEDMPEALFNRALVLEKLSQRAEATDAWQRYLAIDPSSSWGEEAAARLRSLTPVPGGGSSQTPRQDLLDTTLPAWAAAVSRGDRAEAARLLEEARNVLGRLDASGADRYARDVMAAVETTATDAAASRLALVGGLQLYGEARRLAGLAQTRESLVQFKRALESLQTAGSPLALSARLYIARAAYSGGALETARVSLEAIRRDISALPYPSLSGRVDWLLGGIAFRTGRFHDALALYEAAASAFRQGDELDNLAFSQGLLAEAHDRLGDPDRAWRHRLLALAGTAREGTLLSTARSATASGWFGLAAVLQDEAIMSARTGGKTEILVDSLRSRALTDCELGDVRGGGLHLAEARSLIGQRSGATWNRLEAEVDLATAVCATPATAAPGVQAASRSEGYFATIGDNARLIEVYRARARVARLAGRIDEARTDLHRAFALFARHRREIEGGGRRLVDLLDSARLASDDLVLLEVGAGRHAEALEAADLARGWDLLSEEAPPIQGTGIRALQDAIDDRTTIAYFSVGRDASWVWVVRRDQFWLERIAAGRSELGRLLDRSRHDITGDSDRVRDLLFAPVLKRMSAEDLLVIFPDGPLYRLAFAAIRTAPDRFLIEQHPLIVAPGAAAYVAASTHASGFRALPRRVLSIGNPTLDRSRFPDLPALPWAEEEAREIIHTYAGPSVLLLGADAERGRVLRAMPDADVAHFALHAVVDNSSPGESELVVTSATGARLTSDVISGLESPRLRLVVLAACRTLGGRPTTAAGSLGIARAFLQAGVPTVIASPWDVDDRASRRLLAVFHREFARTGDAARSLRSAQVAMLRSGDPTLNDPDHWAGLVAIGGQPRLVD